MIKVALVPQDQLPFIWYQVEPMILKALRYTGGRFRIEDVYNDIIEGRQTLWVAIEGSGIIGCATISITQYPSSKRALVFEYLAGDRIKDWIEEGHRVCSAYGRDQGCSVSECQGRSGWKPFLEKLGWRQLAVKYELDL